MISRRYLMEGTAFFLLSQALRAQTTGGNAKVVFKHDVPDLTLKNWAATVVEVSYAPGQSSPAHRHPGITIAYVLEGEIRSKVGDEPEKTYSAGQVFLETPQQLHAVSRNASATRPAKLLAIMLAERDSQLTIPAQE
jgi:quercetin dioxygenase-like cupin family protein